MQLLLSGQAAGRSPGGEKSQQQEVPTERGRWADGDPRPELQRVPQVKRRRTVGTETGVSGMTKLTL